jgi:hypothetical protein
MPTRSHYHRRERYQCDSIAPELTKYSIKDTVDWLFNADQERFITVDAYSSYRQTKKITRWVDTRYTLTNRKSFNSQRDCMTAWEDMQFPTHSVDYDDHGHGLTAWLYSDPDNFSAYQHADGTGRVVHYSTLAAIRTRNGTVLNNSQDHANGFARVTPAQDAAASIPLTTIKESGVLPDDMDIYDITAVHKTQSLETAYSENSYEQRATKPWLIELRDGSGLVLLKDPSAKQSDENTALFHVSPPEINTVDSVGELETLLVPDAVAQDGRTVVPTNQMVPESQSGRRAQSHYDDRGEVIQRQGEWFFLPVESLPHATELSGRHNLPRECTQCGATQFAVEPRHADCKQCGHRYLTTDSGDLDRVMGNHRPTSFVTPHQTPQQSAAISDGGQPLADDETDESADTRAEIAGYAKGTVRHSDDHYMARLGDTWHLAVSDNRDVVVVDTSNPRYRREGRGRGMRWD